MLIFDEADRLLDMGFQRDIQKILAIINQRPSTIPWKKQTLLFSATINKEIEVIVKNTLSPSHKFIDTVGDEADATHHHVPQYILSVPLGQQLLAMMTILEEKMLHSPYKIIVFFTTARQTEMMAYLFRQAGLDVLEMHSRKSQSYRTRTAEEFRKGSNVIMFTSDVSARGMDYPDVTFVMQVHIHQYFGSPYSNMVAWLGGTDRAFAIHPSSRQDC